MGSGTFYLTALGLNSSSTATEIIAANTSANTLTFVNNSSGSPTTTPTIVQSGAGAFNISANVIAASALTISGTGTGSILFGGTFSGPLVDNYTGSTVTLSGTSTLTSTNKITIATRAVVQSSGELILNGSASAAEVSGAGTLRFTSTAGSTSAPDLQVFTSNTTANDAVTISSAIDLGSANRFFRLYTGRNDDIRYGGDFVISGVISGAGGINLSTPAATGYSTGGTLRLTGANTFTGGVTIGDNTSLYVGNSASLSSANNVNINTTSANAALGNLFLYGRSVTIGNLTGTSTAIVQNGSYNNASTTYVQTAAATLTVQEAGTTTYAGKLIDGNSDNPSKPGTLTYYALGLTKTGAGTLTLGGSNTYTGPTNVATGVLSLGGGATLGTTAVSVGATGGFAARVGSGTASAAGSLSLAAGGTFDMLDGSIGTFNLTGTSGTDLTLAGNTLGFDLAGAGADALTVAGTAAVSGTNTINIQSAAAVLQNGTYNLIAAAGGGLGGTFQFANGQATEVLTLGGVPYTLSLANSGTAEQLTVAGASTDYWRGNLSTSWAAGAGTSTTNWSADPTGASNATIPTASTNVIFTVQGGGQNLNTVLGQDFSIASLTFTSDANQPVTIGGTNTLTVSGGGITVNASSGSHTIATGALAVGATQTWTNNSGNPFTVSAPITGTAATSLTLAGSNTNANAYVLTGSNSYAGTTTINTGVGVTVGNGGTSGTLPAGAVVNNGTVTFNRSDVATVAAGNISGIGSLVQSGSGTSILAGTVTTTGTTTVNSGTLQVNNMTVPAVNSIVQINGGTLAVTGTLTLNASTSADITSVTGGTLALMNPAATAAAPDLYANVASNAYDSVQVTSNIFVGPGTHYIGGHSGNDSYGQYLTGDLGLQGSISGTGNLVVSGAPQNSQFEVVLFSDNSGWTGGLTLDRGDVAISTGNAAEGINSLTGNNTVTFTPATGNTAGLYLFGNSVTIGSLSGTAAGSMYIRNGDLQNVSLDGSSSDAVLTVNQTTNGTFAGVMSDGPNDYYNGTTATPTTGAYNRLGLTLAGTANLTLAGPNTYTGPTTVQSGTLGLGVGGSLGNTAITVNGGTTFAPVANTSAGTIAVAGAGATLTVNGGTIDMTAGGTSTAIGTFALHQNGSFNGTALSLNGASLLFNVSPTGADGITVDGQASVNGTNIITLVPATGTYNPSTYALISALSGLTGTFDFSNNSTTETINGVTYTLINSDGLESLAVNGGAAVPLSAYYTGKLSNVLSAGGNGTATNFATDATGATNTNALPGATTNVFFTATGAQNLSAVLGADLSVNSITFNGNAGGAVQLGGPNTLTIGAGGITLINGSVAATIATGSLVLGADQTWTNNSGNPLLVSAPVSGGNLTFAGTGTTILAGTNAFATANVSAGSTLQVGNGGTAGTLGAATVTDNGTVTFNRSDAVTVANAIAGTGTIVQAGTGTTNVSGASVTTTGGIRVNAGTLAINGSPGAVGGFTVNAGTLAVSGNVGAVGGVTVNGGSALFAGNVTLPGAITVNGGTMNVSGSTTTKSTSVLTINGGVFQSAGTLNLDVSGTTSGASTDVAGGGTLQLIGTANSAAAPDIFFGPDHSGTSYYGALMTVGTLDLGSAQRYVEANSGHNTVAKYYQPTNEVDAYIGSNIIGAGGISYAGNQEGTSGFYAPLVLGGSNSFAGRLEVDQGSVYLGAANALPAGDAVVLANSGTGYSHLFLLGNNATVSNLTSSGTTQANTAIANGNPLMNFTVAAATLTLNQTANTTFAGSVRDTITDTYDSGTNVPGAVSVIKTGPAALTLSGSNTYTGGTTLSAGAIRANSAAGVALGGGPVTINSGATLGGSGTATNASGGTITVNAGGTITAGADAVTVGNLSTGTQAWSGGGTYLAKMATDGSAADRLVMSGLSVTATAGTPFVVNVTGAVAASAPLGQYVLAVDAGTTDPATNTAGDPFALAALTLQINGAAAPKGYSLSEQSDSLGVGGIDLVLTTAAAPEPASLLLAGFAAAPLLLGRRRRLARSR